MHKNNNSLSERSWKIWGEWILDVVRYAEVARHPLHIIFPVDLKIKTFMTKVYVFWLFNLKQGKKVCTNNFLLKLPLLQLIFILKKDYNIFFLYEIILYSAFFLYKIIFILLIWLK